MSQAVQLADVAYQKALYREAVKEGFYELQVGCGRGCQWVCLCGWVLGSVLRGPMLVVALYGAAHRMQEMSTVSTLWTKRG